MNKLFLILAIAFSSSMLYGQGTPPYKFSKKIVLPGDGKWDYMSLDNAKNRLYVSHGDRVHVIDLQTDKAIGEWTGLESVHGIAFSEAEGKVYVANTGSNNVIVYNAGTLEKTGTILLPEGKKPDCILFDVYSQKAFVFCGKSDNVFVVDGKTDKVTAVVSLGGKPEFACTDEKGLIYNNLEDKNEVVVIDAGNNRIVKRFPLSGKAPTGIAIDRKNNLLLVTCEESEKMLVLSAATGQEMASLPMGKKTDGVIYEKDLHLAVTSNGEGSATVIRQEGPEKYQVVQTLKTQTGLKTIVYQEKTHRLFISGADLQSDGKTAAPGTFGVYVYTVD